MIVVKNRELLIPKNEYYIGTTYDNNTESRLFKIDRLTVGGIDIGNLDFKLDIKYANGGYDSAELDKELPEGKDYILLTLHIVKSMLQVPGTLLINIRGLNTDGLVKWSSYVGALFVEDSINTPGHYTGDLTELEKLETRVEGVLTSEDERKSAELNRQSAEAERQSAESLRETAEALRNTAEEQRSLAESQRQETFNQNISGWDSRVQALEDGYTETSLLAKSYAVGGTGTREGEDTDNAKYYNTQAQAVKIGKLTTTNGQVTYADAKAQSEGGEITSLVSYDGDTAKSYKFNDETARNTADAKCKVVIGAEQPTETNILWFNTSYGTDPSVLSVALDLSENSDNSTLLASVDGQSYGVLNTSEPTMTGSNYNYEIL